MHLGIIAKRILPAFLAFFLLFSSAFQGLAQEVLLHEEVDGFPVTRGVTYEGRTVFTSLGWQKIHILKVDLTSENVDIDAIMNTKGLSERQILSRMVAENGAVAGVNGDFFIMANPSSPIGVQVTDGELISSPSNRKDMAAFALTFEKIPQLLRLEFTGKVEAPDGTSFEIGGVNKVGTGQGRIMVYTPDFGKTTPALPAGTPDMTFAVIENGEVVNIFDGRSAEIPHDSLILAAIGAGSEFLKNKFAIGDVVKIDLKITPDISNLKMALGGGAVLVENGAIPPTFSHNIAGQNPRTAIGFTKDGKTLILAVVDGRQAESRGMTQEELARLMLNLGAYNAINLDGGGSSTMVVRAPGEKAPAVINSVSEKTERPVVNGLGIFAKLPSSGKVHGFKIVASSFNIPKKGHRVFDIKAFDENYNPVDVDPSLIRWSVSGGLGTFSGNVLYAEKSGTGTVTASLGDLKASVNIRVLQDTAAIAVEPARIQLSPGGKKSFAVYAVDRMGYRAPIEPVDITWEVTGNPGYFENGVFIASTSPGVGAVIARFMNLKAGALVKVGDSGEFDESLLPPVPLPVDEANTPFQSDSVTFGVFGDLLMGTNYSQAYQKTFNMASSVFGRFKTGFNVIAGRAYVGGLAPQNGSAAAVLKNYRMAGSGYSTHAVAGTFFIFLDASKGSLRLTNPGQWLKLKEDVKSAASKYKNIIVVLDRTPEAFKDPLEGDLLKKVLSDHRDAYRNMWVISGGAEKFSTRMEDGIRYVNVPGVNAREPAAVLVNIQGDRINYRVVPLLEKIITETPALKMGQPTVLKIYGISPAGHKIQLGYPYSVEYAVSPAGSASFDAKTLTINAKKSGEIYLTVKTEGLTEKIRLQVVDLTVKVNGVEVDFPDQQPYINSEQRTMVPVRFISESLGARVHWDSKNNMVIIEGNGKNISLKIGEKKAILNGKTVPFDTKAELKNSRTMVPLRFVSEVLGAKVVWNPAAKTVEISR
ncbi:phosphodiester glycosidase family protein [Thermosediminibacter oceani]|uniref:Copper amine oxidase domain protein n=1 Tax=Thermosediminibacter oceani (strain ATCC BAA-1034 / DSM 16646 / JW/IW-1228P) TaxID=555079 RepID=D9RZ56_THEOJ|nr:phosphodiester glycosidase family protein [Thermosediminibacter oceani]ADL08610.1 copper amine oxidase domain protein [Thermosediminibacter oceani DSM 16646]